jgi:hypothetical protein
MASTRDETPRGGAEHLLADRNRFQLSPDAWAELVAIMDREARPNPKLAKLFSRPSAAEAPGPASLLRPGGSHPMPASGVSVMLARRR